MSSGCRKRVTSSLLCECEEGAADQELVEPDDLAIEDAVGGAPIGQRADRSEPAAKLAEGALDEVRRAQVQADGLGQAEHREELVEIGLETADEHRGPSPP